MNNGDPLVRFVPVGAGTPADLTPDEARVLETVNVRIAAGQSLAELLDFLFETTRSICPCDRISVAFLDESGERLVSNHTRAAYEPVLLRPGFAQDLHGSSLREVVERGEPRIIADLETYLSEHPKSVSTQLLVREGVRSSMTCPLAVEGRTVGVLFRSSRRPSAYDDRQAALHQVVAARLGQAVEKVYRIEQLSQANRAYMEMLGFVSHELKGPLAVINMSSEILLNGYVGVLGDKQREVTDRIRSQTQRLIGMVRDYLDLARIEGGEMRLAAVDGVWLVGDVLEPAIEQGSPALAERLMTLERRFQGIEDLRLRADAALLRIVVDNFLSNAVKYGKKGGIVRVGAERIGDDRVRVFVWNEGQGFRDTARGSLFRRFSRIASPEFTGISGTGIGLYSAWRIVRLHGGRTDAKSEFGRWAEFAFEIPLRSEDEPAKSRSNGGVIVFRGRGVRMKTFCCIVGVMAVVSVAFANGVASWLRMQKEVIRQHRDALAAMYTNDIQVFVSDCRHSHGIRVDYAVTQYGEILRGRSDFFPDAPKLSPVRRLDGEERLTLRTRIAELRPYISGGMYAVWISVREGDSLTATFAYPKECPTNEAAAKLLGMLAEMAGATNAVRESRKR